MRDAQTVTWNTGGAKLLETAPLVHNPESPIQPDALIIFRGSQALDGSGVGDTADCRVSFPLPGNWIYQLHSWSVTYESAAREYTRCVFEMYYAGQPGGFGSTTQLNYPVIVSGNTDVAELGTKTIHLIPGAVDSAGVPITVPDYAQPFRIFTIGADIGGTDPVLWLGSGAGTDVESGTLRLELSFARYSLQQFISSGLYTGLSGR